MKQLSLLDNSLEVSIYFEHSDSEYADDICVCFKEYCQEEEKIFKAGETNIFLTPDQANQLALALIEASKQSLGFRDSEHEPQD
ncbi:MAG: hypothetical protein DWQ04_20065 [Chloroflexi bacterium]|nr:MAG: hypothetical protein DWQ04_20065 [Chloroflexota bacterium]